MPDLLLELFSEEIPARMQARAAADLERLVSEGLKAEMLGFEAINSYATPRRLVLHVTGLPERQPDVREERRGPRADAPEKAVEGFLKSAGLTRDQVEEREEAKGTFLYAVIEKRGETTANVLCAMLPGLIAGFPWPKSMRWGAGDLRWVRPLHGILCLFGGEVVPFAVDGISSGRTTRGHRFHAPAAFEVASFEDYEQKLKDAHVILDPAKRQAIIAKLARELAAEAGLALVEDEQLLAENAGLTEWPVPLMGAFDEAFLDVPAEVLTATMKKNQKYFTLRDASGKMANRFICVANLVAADGGEAITRGNERVLSARLSDAKFFWEQDLKVPLEEFAAKLGGVTFHEKLGTVGDKAERMAALARYLAPEGLGDKAALAARLAKADLVSGMVGEFPEVQGIMGGYYARAQREDTEVAQAIAEHYSPQGPSDTCPTEPVSVAVALADKIDTLVGFFGIDERPTGSKDPYALRRAALGAIRLITENNVRLKLSEVLYENLRILVKQLLVRKNYGGVILSSEDKKGHPLDKDNPDADLQKYLQGRFEITFFREEGELTQFGRGTRLQPKSPPATLLAADVVKSQLLDFFADRLKVQQREKGVPHDLIDAVFSLGGEDDLVRLLNRVEALQDFLTWEDGANLLAGYRRAANIVRIEEKKDGAAFDGPVMPDLLEQPEEKQLFEKLSAAKAEAAAAVEVEDFAAAMAALAKLRQPVDAFFDHVTVNADDAALRRNRLNLLNDIRVAVHTVADFSRIQG